MYIYMYIYTHVYIYIYIYIERERHMYMYNYVCMYVYVYSYHMPIHYINLLPELPARAGGRGPAEGYDVGPHAALPRLL